MRFQGCVYCGERDIFVTKPDKAKRNKAVTFKNNAPFINCISKINSVKIDNAEDLGVVMPTYNLLEYSKNYRKTTGSLWNYYRDEPSNPLSSDSESFKYKTSVTGYTYNIGDGEDNYDVTLSKENDTKVLEQLKTGFKKTIKWNKYRSQMTAQPRNNNLNYLIDPTFTNVNRLFVLPSARTNPGDNRDSFSHYYVPNVETKVFNVLSKH